MVLHVLVSGVVSVGGQLVHVDLGDVQVEVRELRTQASAKEEHGRTDAVLLWSVTVVHQGCVDVTGVSSEEGDLGGDVLDDFDCGFRQAVGGWIVGRANLMPDAVFAAEGGEGAAELWAAVRPDGAGKPEEVEPDHERVDDSFCVKSAKLSCPGIAGKAIYHHDVVVAVEGEEVHADGVHRGYGGRKGACDGSRGVCGQELVAGLARGDHVLDVAVH